MPNPCNYCNNPLPIGSTVRRKYCSEQCKRKAFRRDSYIPSLAHGEHYQFWQSLQDCSKEELQILFKIRKENCRHARCEDIMRLRKEMKLIGLMYRKVKSS